MADLVVRAANLHNQRDAARRALTGRPDVVLVSEAQKVHDALAGARGYRYLTGALPGPSREVGILVTKRTKRLRLRGHVYAFLSAAARKFKRVGKERWGQVALVKVGGRKVAIIALHPVAGPSVLAGFDPNHLLVRRYASAMRWLEQTARFYARRGCEVVIGGDLNMRESWDRPWSPHAVLREHHMETYWHGIDLIAWTPGLTRAGEPFARDIGSDHPALTVALNRTKRSKR